MLQCFFANSLLVDQIVRETKKKKSQKKKIGSESMSHHHHLSFKKKLKSTLCIAGGCFGTTNHPQSLPEQPSSPTSPNETSTHSPTKTKSPRLARTLSKSHEKCKSLIHRIGEGKHIRRHTTDFHYDPSSYALNFDRGEEDENVNRFPLHNFSSRLPHSPPSSTTSPGSSLVIHNLLR